MAKQKLVGFAIFLSGVLFFQAVALTDDEQGIFIYLHHYLISGNCCLCDCDFAVEGLRDFYRTLNSPAQLKNWKLEGGDPCEESWTGVSCHQSSVIEMYKSFLLSTKLVTL